MQIAFEHSAKENEKKLIRTMWTKKSQRKKKKVKASSNSLSAHPGVLNKHSFALAT